jgi:hypothetical protein
MEQESNFPNEEDIMDMINPHLSNTIIKNGLQKELRLMGIVRLADTTPKQYPEICRRFAKVIAEHTEQITINGGRK